MRMELLRLTHSEAPAEGLPHWVGKLGLHWMPHTVLLQMRVPWLPVSLGQVVLQVPQKLGSDVRSTHSGPLRVLQGVRFGARHVTVHWPAQHGALLRWEERTAGQDMLALCYR